MPARRPPSPPPISPAVSHLAVADIARRPTLLPESPGVYLFRDRAGSLLYVGKADRLRDRVRSYFGSPGPAHPRTRRLVDHVHSVETVVTANRREALLLEAQLIRTHKPPYNVNLRDGQRYPYVCFTHGPFPRVVVTRVPSSFPGPCHGPFTDVRSLREALRLLRVVVPLRTCSDRQFASRSRPCILYQMRRCLAPCSGPEVAGEYQDLVRQARAILDGRVRRVVEGLRTTMDRRARELRYEEAAVLRDRIAALQRLAQRQRVVLKARVDLDSVAVARAGATAIAVVRSIREGTLIGQRVMPLGAIDPQMPGTELLEQVMSRYYAGAPIPPTVLVAESPGDARGLECWLREARGGPVRICRPVRGVRAELVRSTQRNAETALEAHMATGEAWSARVAPGIVRLTAVLGLTAPPRRITGMDASHFAGREPVGSLVLFEEGRPLKRAYRRYAIKGAAPDDAGMLAEVASRWIARVASGELPRPDLVVVDGGPVQVDAVAGALAAHQIAAGIEVIGLAKREEIVHRVAPLPPLRLPRRDEGLRLLQRIRDEAHRFAVSYHRKRRQRAAVRNPLEEIPGIGPRRARALLGRFGSIEGLRAASRDDIMATSGIGSGLAEAIVVALARSNA